MICGGGGYSGGRAYNSGFSQLVLLSGSQYAGNGYATLTELTAAPTPHSNVSKRAPDGRSARRQSNQNLPLVSNKQNE